MEMVQQVQPCHFFLSTALVQLLKKAKTSHELPALIQKLDRYGLLVHHGHIVGIKGESYRQKAAAARVSRDAPERPMSLMQSGPST